MKIVFLTILMIFAFNFCFAQEKVNSCMLQGECWACKISAPDGWVLDQESFSQYGISGLFYEEGKALGGSTPIIYVNSEKLSRDTDASLKRFIKSDLGKYEKKGASVKAVKLEGVTDKRIDCYSIETGRSAELCAYTRFKNVCFLIVLTANTADGISRNISNMEELINNMEYMERN
ncbi:MAG: hypothetical protein K6G00_10695 [Treponema sp.]|nr:hypothetical protein [Treponema sp.]